MPPRIVERVVEAVEDLEAFLIGIDVLHHQRVEGFLRGEQSREGAAERRGDALPHRGSRALRTGNAPVGVELFDELAADAGRREAGAARPGAPLAHEPTTPSSGLLAVAYILRGMRPAR